MNIKIYTYDNEYEELKNILEENKQEYTIIEDKTKPLECNPYLVEYININQELLSRQRIVKVERTDELFNILNMKPTKKSFLHYGTYKEFKDSFKKPIEKPIIEYPEYPIYIISYKRHENPITIDLLKNMNVPFKVVIKNEDYENYKTILTDNEILVVPEEFMKNEIESGNGGGIPQRNYCLYHSTKEGFKKHFIMDDNIRDFKIITNGFKYEYNYPNFFKRIEEFSNHIKEDVGLIGCNYSWDFPVDGRKQYNIGGKTYSMILMNNEVLNKYNIKWRRTYNEDVRINFESQDKGVRTIGLNSMLINKCKTGSIKGGNQDIYKDDGLLKKLDEIYEEYPNYIIRTNKRHKDGRPHHIIKRGLFKNLNNITIL